MLAQGDNLGLKDVLIGLIIGSDNFVDEPSPSHLALPDTVPT